MAGDYGYGKMEDLYAALGFGKFSARQVLQKLVPAQTPEPAAELEPEPASQGAMTSRTREPSRLAEPTICWCIAPSAATPFAGKPSSGTSRAEKAWRFIPAIAGTCKIFSISRKEKSTWLGAAALRRPCRHAWVVHTDDRPGLLNQITAILSNEAANIRSLEAKTENEQGGDALIEMTIDVRDKKQLEKLVSSMRRISGIRDVERSFQ